MASHRDQQKSKQDPRAPVAVMPETCSSWASCSPRDLYEDVETGSPMGTLGERTLLK